MEKYKMHWRFFNIGRHLKNKKTIDIKTQRCYYKKALRKRKKVSTEKV